MNDATLIVGVTGHRHLHGVDDVRTRVSEALDRVAAPVELLTSLAKGADRVVADAVAARGGSLVAVLPFPVDEYRRDFPDSAADFDRLLALASRTVVMPGDPADRPTAYEHAGRHVVDSSDVLLALWDGLPARGRGGTAEIIRYARSIGRRVIVIPVSRTSEMHPDPGATRTDPGAFRGGSRSS